MDGAPDFILEIVAPDSVSRDYRDKYDEYQRAGVKEYWLIDPMAQRIEAHRLARKKFHPIAVSGEKLASAVLPGFYLRREWLFPKLVPAAHALRELGIRL